MAYSHQWTRPEDLDPKQFKRYAKAAAKLVKHARAFLDLAGPGGEGRPVVETTRLIVNGSALVHEHYEDLVIEQSFTPPYSSWSPTDDGRAYEFCKTNRMAYDVLAVALLIVLAHHFPDDVTLTSDGYRDDWIAGAALAERVLGYGTIPDTIHPRPVTSSPADDDGPPLFDAA